MPGGHEQITGRNSPAHQHCRGGLLGTVWPGWGESGLGAASGRASQGTWRPWSEEEDGEGATDDRRQCRFKDVTHQLFRDTSDISDRSRWILPVENIASSGGMLLIDVKRVSCLLGNYNFVKCRGPSDKIIIT